MRHVDEIRLTETEIRAWQDAAGGPVLGVLGKVLQRLYDEAGEVFARTTAGLEELKVAQGVADAAKKVEKWSEKILQVDLEAKEEEDSGDDDDDTGGEVDVAW